LQVINSSPGDLAPVFDAMLEKALDLCGAAFGTLWIRDREFFNAAALRRVPVAYAEFLAKGPVRATPGANSGLGSLLDGKALFHLLDVSAEPAYRGGNPGARALIELGGARTTAGVPLRKDGALVGAITIYRQEVRAFSDKQIALLQNFAAQAVIAMENARLMTETREALERQTATAEVLQVINSSPGELTPVFDAILEKAHSLCGATQGGLFTYDGQYFRAVVTHGAPEPFAEALRKPFGAPTGSAQDRLIGGARLVHIPDITGLAGQLPEFPVARAAVQAGVRTLLMVPLRNERDLLGYIAAFRQEVRPFTDKQIALLQNFAAQAVIAMENARLISETREALEQQTATAEVLQVINSSPGDLAPVFDAILEKAHALCGIALGELELHENGKVRAVAMRGVSGPFADLLRQPFAPPPGSPPARLLAGERTVQISDVSELAQERPNDPRAQAGAQAGLRTALFVPLRKDDCL